MERDWKWDWWGESPVELVVVILFLAFFFAFPRTGLGISTVVDGNPTSAPVIAE
jgi:hypothetical protein